MEVMFVGFMFIAQIVFVLKVIEWLFLGIGYILFGLFPERGEKPTKSKVHSFLTKPLNPNAKPNFFTKRLTGKTEVIVSLLGWVVVIGWIIYLC